MVIEKRLSDQNTEKRKDDFHRIELTDKLKVATIDLKKLTEEHTVQTIELKKITLAWEIASNEGNNTNKSLDAARRELADKLITLRVAKKDNEVN
jgi:hypothetical protein